jgi:hypothetical protein
MTETNALARGHEGRLIVASIASYNVANLLLWLQPAIMAELLGTHRLSSSQAGWIGSVAMLVLSLVILMYSQLQRPFAYRSVALFGILLTMAAGVSWLFAEGFVALLVVLALGSVGFGLLMVAPSMALAGVRTPVATFGRMYAVNLVCSSALLFFLPQIGVLFGRPPAIPAILIVAVTMLPLILLMPRAASSSARRRPAVRANTADAKVRIVRWLAGGVAAIGLAYGQVWAFFTVLGEAGGLTADQATEASGLSLMGALAGSLTASYIERILGGRRMLMLSLAGMAISLMLVIRPPLPIAFITAGVTAQFFMYLFFPTVLGVAAICDPGGRGIALINGCLAILAGAGPLVAGVLINARGTSALSVVTLASVAIAMVTFMVAWRSLKKEGVPVQGVIEASASP